MKVYTRNNKPDPSQDDPSFSQDVIIMTEDEMLNIGYFDYEQDKWKYHTDTLVDLNEPDEEGVLIKFNWIYPPKELFVIKQNITKI